MSALGTLFYGHRAIEKAASLTGFTVDQILGRDRLQTLCEARFAIWMAMRNHGSSLPQIGRCFNRDHSTILSGLRRADRLMRDKHFAQFVETLEG